jgi:hypothetical protein
MHARTAHVLACVGGFVEEKGWLVERPTQRQLETVEPAI